MKFDTTQKVNGYPITGMWSGPHTALAIDYNGHAVQGVQVSDELADGSAYMVLLDEHMQVTVTPVIGNSIRPLENDEPVQPPFLRADAEDYASTRKNLEELAAQLHVRAQESTDDLRAYAIVLAELADVIDGQESGVKPQTYLHRASPDAGRNAEQIVEVNGGTFWKETDYQRQEADFSHSICSSCGHFLLYDNPTWIPANGCRMSLKGATCTKDRNVPDTGMVYCIDYAEKETIRDIDPDYAEDVR